MEYVPVCALVHIQCFRAPCEPVQQTFGNKCMMEANNLAEYIHDGECETSCPQRSQPAPSFCPDGVIVDAGKDAN